MNTDTNTNMEETTMTETRNDARYLWKQTGI